MRNRHKQQGLSMMGWLAAIAVFAAVLTLFLRLGPHYMDYQTIDSMLSGMQDDPIHTMTKPKIRELLKKRLTINSIRDIKIREVFNIERTRDNTVIHLDYEVRDHLFYNVDVVLDFDKEYAYQ